MVTGLDFKVLLMDMRKTSVVVADSEVTVPEVGTASTNGEAEVPAPEVAPSTFRYEAPVVSLFVTGRADAEVVATRPVRARAAAAATAISFLDI
jgi:hypothetical protein